jgi:uncharacterized protein (DUF58 family)
MKTLSPSPLWIAIFGVIGVAAVAPTLFGDRWWPLWLTASAAVVLLFALDAMLAPRRRHLEIGVEIPATLSVGIDRGSTLRNRASYGRSRGGRVRFECSADLGLPDEIAVDLGPEPQSVEIAHRPRRRGTMTVAAVWCRFTGPLGLARRCYRLPVNERIKVISNVHAVTSLALAFTNPNERLYGLKIERYTGDGSDFHSMRQYQPGFDLQSIDWKASARHRRLLCREFRAERNHHIVVALDTGRLMAEEVEGLPRLDHAIHGALLLALMSLRSGDRVSLYSFAATPGLLSSPCAGTGGFRALLDVSSNLAYSDDETNFTLGLTQLAASLTRRSLVVVVTDFVDTVAAELMIENVARLARTHLVVFAALQNPELDAIIDAAPESIHDLERAVVADGLARDRRTVIGRLRRAGALCVDSKPHQLGAGLVHRYLEIKRREMV